MRTAIKRLKETFDGYRATAKREEDVLWATAILATKHRKRPFNLQIASRAVALLMILHGEREVAERLGISRGRLGVWFNVWLLLGGES